MKANAKKLLALIMAMVMCLSLAAPAFAADNSADASASLSVQAATDYVGDVKYATDTDVFQVFDLNNNVHESFKPSEVGTTATAFGWVSAVKSVLNAAKVGANSETRYVITPNAAVATDTTLKSYTFDLKGKDAVTLEDASIAWTTLSNERNWYEDTSGYQTVDGSYFVEKQNGNSWKVFYKLKEVAEVESKTSDGKTVKKDVFKDFSTTTPGTFAVVTLDKEPTTDVAFRYALKNAQECDKNGDVGKGAKKTYKVASTKTPTTSVTYSYDVLPAKGTAKGTDIIAATLAETSDFSATFQVRATYNNDKGLAVREDDADKLKVALNAVGKDASPAWKVSTIGSAADANGYFAVTAEKIIKTVEETGYDGTASKEGNTALYTFKNKKGGSESKVVLIDVAKNGTYTNSSSKKQDTIAAGYKYAGPVAVKKADITADDELSVSTDTNLKPVDEVEGWLYWETADAMEAAISNSNCGKGKTISYVQLNVYATNGSTANKGITEKNGDVSWNKGWATTAGADFVTKTLNKDASANHAYREVTTMVASTCKKEGTVTVKNVCGICNTEKVVSTTTLPIDASNVKKGDKERENYISSDKTGHYIASYETAVTTNSKTGKGSVTYTFKCNYGEVHDELTYTKEIDKVALQHSGKWDKFTWSTQNTANVRNPAYLYGYTVRVFDSDVEYTDVAINGDSDAWFGFNYVGSPRADGTYFDDGLAKTVYVSKIVDGKVVTEITPSYYQATVTVKDIKVGEKDCLDGSATIELNVYKIATGTDLSTPEKVADALKNKTATLVNTESKAVTVPAEKTHVDANNDGKCDNCGTEINQTTPINENTVDISKAVVKFDALTYTGKVAQPKVTVTLDGVTLAKGIDYEVEELQAVNVGTYPLVVKGKGDFSGRVVGNVTIKVATKKQSLKVSVAKKTYKVKTVKKKAQKFTTKLTGAKTAVAWKSSNKKVTVKVSGNKATITVKKGTKKGTYKVTATAKKATVGNVKYKKATATIKVVVK